jgi:hypothetical protein
MKETNKEYILKRISNLELTNQDIISCTSDVREILLENEGKKMYPKVDTKVVKSPQGPIDATFFSLIRKDKVPFSSEDIEKGFLKMQELSINSMMSIEGMKNFLQALCDDGAGIGTIKLIQTLLSTVYKCITEHGDYNDEYEDIRTDIKQEGKTIH